MVKFPLYAYIANYNILAVLQDLIIFKYLYIYNLAIALIALKLLQNCIIYVVLTYLLVDKHHSIFVLLWNMQYSYIVMIFAAFIHYCVMPSLYIKSNIASAFSKCFSTELACNNDTSTIAYDCYITTNWLNVNQ